ncbi:hypothetical protein EDC04DRAFT_2568161 [Pisolithus marmoratus]|nr:hypothetical protein EDC04DRAFT_2568161 [Pisolithus marmoratus]
MADSGRSHRIGTPGNLQLSMRANYDQLGVDNYYRKVGATYRNPHFPGVRACIFTWLDRWWKHEREIVGPRPPVIFDMACGSGEVTVAAYEWWKGAGLKSKSRGPPKVQSGTSNPSSVHYPADMHVMAADPYTAEAYVERTMLPCAPLTFTEIAQGALPPVISSFVSLCDASNSQASALKMDMTICSFALHLVESPSELFVLLWELSINARWLIVLSPHKKPEIKDGWGWVKWDCENWSQCQMSDRKGEYVLERVHCRVYCSVNAS